MKKALNISLLTVSFTVLFTLLFGKDPVTLIKDSSQSVQIVSVVLSIMVIAIILMFDLKQKHHNKVKNTERN